VEVGTAFGGGCLSAPAAGRISRDGWCGLREGWLGRVAKGSW
jgi:hypothetical protein